MRTRLSLAHRFGPPQLFVQLGWPLRTACSFDLFLQCSFFLPPLPLLSPPDVTCVLELVCEACCHDYLGLVRSQVVNLGQHL